MTNALPPTDDGIERPARKASLLSSLSKSARAATKIVALQAERTKLNTITIPAAHFELGKDCIQNKRHLEFVTELTKQLRAVLTEIKQLSEATKKQPEAQNFTDRAKAAGKLAVDSARQKQLSVRRDSLITMIGKTIYEKHFEQSGPSDLIAKLKAAYDRRSYLESEIARQTTINGGSILTPKRLIAVALIMGLAIIGFPLRTFLFAWGKRPTENLAQASQSASSTDRLDAVNANALPVEGRSTLEQLEYDLPKEISDRPGWPKLALLSMPKTLAIDAAKLKNSPVSNGTSHRFFSPNGKHVLVLFEKNGKQEVRIWNVETGIQYAAKSEACNYFSFPAAFSPDDSAVACIDGDFLRIWSLTSPTVPLLQTVPLSSPSDWNGLSWSIDATLVLRSRSESTGTNRYQIVNKKSDRFAVAGPIINAQELSRDNYTAVSQDGQYLARIGKTDEGSQELQVIHLGTGKVLSTAVLPGLTLLPMKFPTAMLIDQTSENGAWTDPGSPIEFSPSTNNLLLSAANESLGHRLFSLRTDELSNRIPLELDLQGNKEDRRDPLGKPRLHCFSPDGQKLAVITTSSIRTTRSDSLQRTCVIVDMATGKRTQNIKLGEAFELQGRGDIDQRLRGELCQFSNDGSSIFVTVLKQKGVTQANWSFGAWNVSDGRQTLELSGVLNGNVRKSNLALSPNGELLITPASSSSAQLHSSMLLWDIPHLAKLQQDARSGDSFWDTSDRSKSLEYYCSILGDDMSWFLRERLPQMYSRCIDVFAERGETAKGRGVVCYANRLKISITPETAKGKELVNEFRQELTEARQELSKQRDAEYNAKKTERRAANKRKFVPSIQLSKSEFIAKLKSTMRKGGRIDNTFIYAIFDDNSMLDVFGEPETNVEWIDSQRLISYDCSDGTVQLTVMFLGEMVILQGINQY